MIVALFANMQKHSSYAVAKQVTEFLQKRGVTVLSRDAEAEALLVPPLSSVPSDQIDCLISLGGDGTILRLIHHFLN